ncbi:MAG TPA: hypothetical protein VF284_04835 [Rhodanobacteraceae bacterium]
MTHKSRNDKHEAPAAAGTGKEPVHGRKQHDAPEHGRNDAPKRPGHGARRGTEIGEDMPEDR